MTFTIKYLRIEYPSYSPDCIDSKYSRAKTCHESQTRSFAAVYLILYTGEAFEGYAAVFTNSKASQRERNVDSLVKLSIWLVYIGPCISGSDYAMRSAQFLGSCTKFDKLIAFNQTKMISEGILSTGDAYWWLTAVISHRDKTKVRRHGALKRDQRHYSTGAGRQVKAAERSTAFSLPMPTTPSMRSLSWNACYLRRSTPMRVCVCALDPRIRPWRGERVGICADRWPT